MELLQGLPKETREHPCVLAIGKFDGLHRGHAEILRMLREAAGDADVCVFSLSGGEERLLSESYRHALFAEAGVDVLYECPFTEELRQMTADAFAREIIAGKLRCRCVVVGDDFHYGNARQGNADTLREAGAREGFSVVVVPRLQDGGAAISSTRIRALLKAGNTAEALRLLGHSLA